MAELGVTYLPFTISSDAGYADLPLALLGAPVDIGALIKTWVTVSWQGQDRDWQAALPGQDHMDPFGFIGVAPRYIPAGAVSELAGIRLSCTSTPTRIRKKHRRGIGFRATPLIPWGFQIAHLSVKSHPGIAPSPSLTNTKHGWFASTKTNVNHGACAGEGRPSVVGLARALDVAGARVK